MKTRRIVVPYIHLVTMRPKTLWGCLKEFVTGCYARPQSWYSVYTTVTGEIATKHWRWGVISWGFTLKKVEVPS